MEIFLNCKKSEVILRFFSNELNSSEFFWCFTGACRKQMLRDSKLVKKCKASNMIEISDCEPWSTPIYCDLTFWFKISFKWARESLCDRKKSLTSQRTSFGVSLKPSVSDVNFKLSVARKTQNLLLVTEWLISKLSNCLLSSINSTKASLKLLLLTSCSEKCFNIGWCAIKSLNKSNVTFDNSKLSRQGKTNFSVVAGTWMLVLKILRALTVELFNHVD